MVPVRLRACSDHNCGLNQSGGHFQLPVCVLRGTACPVRARGHIGAGQIGQRVHCQLPSLASAKVTAVDQEVGVCRQAPTDLLKLFSVGRADRILRQEAGAEMHLGFGAIADEVDRIDARSAGEDLRHLGHAVAGRVEYMYLDVGADAVEELSGSRGRSGTGTRSPGEQPRYRTPPGHRTTPGRRWWVAVRPSAHRTQCSAVAASSAEGDASVWFCAICSVLTVLAVATAAPSNMMRDSSAINDPPNVDRVPRCVPGGTTAPSCWLDRCFLVPT